MNFARNDIKQHFFLSSSSRSPATYRQLVVQQRNREPLVDDPVGTARPQHADPEPAGAEAPESHLHLSGIEQQRHESHQRLDPPGHEP